MSNTFITQLKNSTNYGYTENQAIKHLTTNSAVYDLFAFGASYRSRSDDDCIFLFKKAFEQDSVLALKCLFWIRDCRGGAGERRFFRVCFKWLAENYPDRAQSLIQYLPEFGRYDDLFELFGTSLEDDVMNLIREQLKMDMASKKNGISLIAKWLPSCNASSQITKARARKVRDALGVTERQYRKMLSKLREKINVLERLMSANEWEKIEFDSIPSRAGIIYKNAFARRDIIAKKYEAFAKDKTTKVNATTLYPYEVVAKALQNRNMDETDRAIVNKYWENLVDYLNGADCSMMCVVDTSGSMCGSGAAAPINVAISLGLYCAERIGGPFKNHYISFSSRPQLIATDGVDFVDKVRRIYRTNLCENTNLDAVFDLLLDTALKAGVKDSDIPKTILILSDMEIDSGTDSFWGGWSRDWSRTCIRKWTQENAKTNMEAIREKWSRYGLTLPRLVYWNIQARHETILDSGPNVSFVSGMSPTLFKSILTGKSGWDLCLETICADRYSVIK